MNPQLQQLFTDLDAIAGKMDAALAKAEAYGPGVRAEFVRPHVKTAHDLTAAYGVLLRDAATWDRDGQQGEIAGAYGRSLDQRAAPATGLRPGEMVADVGTLPVDQGAFDGKLNPTLMSGPNWGYYAKQNLGAQSGHIFDRPFVIGDSGLGTTFDAGTLANLENVADPIVRDAQGNQVADLSTFG